MARHRGKESNRNISLDVSKKYVYNVGILADLLGAFEQAVLLTIVQLAEDAYGRGVLRGVQSSLNREISAGAIYTTLDRLEQKGLISSRIQAGTDERGGRARRYYLPTAAGIKELNESKSSLERMWKRTSWPLQAPV